MIFELRSYRTAFLCILLGSKPVSCESPDHLQTTVMMRSVTVEKQYRTSYVVCIINDIVQLLSARRKTDLSSWSEFRLCRDASRVTEARRAMLSRSQDSFEWIRYITTTENVFVCFCIQYSLVAVVFWRNVIHFWTFYRVRSNEFLTKINVILT